MYKHTGKGPNVINLFARTPTTHILVVPHHDPPWVLAYVFDHLCWGSLNVQETENMIFEGAATVMARVNLDGAPSADPMRTIGEGHQDVGSLRLVKI